MTTTYDLTVLYYNTQTRACISVTKNDCFSLFWCVVGGNWSARTMMRNSNDDSDKNYKEREREREKERKREI